MVDYILVSREVSVYKMIIEDKGAVELGSDHNLILCNWTVESRESDTRRIGKKKVNEHSKGWWSRWQSKQEKRHVEN